MPRGRPAPVKPPSVMKCKAMKPAGGGAVGLHTIDGRTGPTVCVCELSPGGPILVAAAASYRRRPPPGPGQWTRDDAAYTARAHAGSTQCK